MTIRVIRALLVLFGAVCVGVGVNFLLERSRQEIVSAAIWFTVPAVVSDLVLLPVAAVVGHVLTKSLAPWARLPAQVAAVLVGTLLLIAVPYLGKPGRHADNPTLLNRNYLLGYLVYVVIIIVAAAVWALLRRRAAGTPQTDR